MQTRSLRTFLVVTVFCLFGAAREVCSQPVAEPPKLAEQEFKNIQALKGTPADQLFPAMQFISASLGVECDFCHVQGKFDADDKRPKLAARKMIAMTFGINKEHFDGHREVTCNSCHNGKSHPAGTPPVADQDFRPERPAANAAGTGSGATIDQVLAKYLEAVGGVEAIKKISSRVEKGHITAMGDESAIELFMKAPDKRISIMHTPRGDSITAFDGKAGWLGNAGRPPRDMGAGEAAGARLDADFYFATHLRETFNQLRPGRPEKIGDRDANVVMALREDQPPVRLYFDQGTGLLVRMVRYVETPLGRMPTQIDYADYRSVDGIKIPFRWTLSRPNGRFTIQVDEVRQNVPVPDEKFAKPAASEPAGR